MRVVIISGASRGLGFALMQSFSGAGWQVVGTGRSAAPAQMPNNAHYHQFDASDATACERFWAHFKKEFPGAEVCLVNNAGGYASGTLSETPAVVYAQLMQSCYYSAVFMTRGLVEVVPRARIINIISANALSPRKKDVAYGAAKAAEKYFFQSLQKELPKANYQITNLYPSDIASHGPNPEAIEASELAEFVRQQAEGGRSFYLADVTLYPDPQS